MKSASRPLPPGTAPSSETWAARWNNLRSAYGNIPRSFLLVWNAYPAGTLAMGVVTLLSAFLPATQAWTGKLIVDTVVRTTADGMTPSHGLLAVLPFLLLEFALLTLSSALNQGRTLLEHVLHSRVAHSINATIMHKAQALDLSYFENAEFYDRLQNARRESDRRALSIVNMGFLTIQNVVTLASFALILLAFNPAIALILFGATMPLFIAQTRYSGLYFRLLTWRAPEFRRMVYLEHLLTVDTTAKEIKLFGLSEPMLKRYQDLFWEFHLEDEKLAKRRSVISTGWGLLGTFSYYGAYAWIVWVTVAGHITLGDMILYITLFRQSQSIFQGLFYNLGQLYESGLFMTNLFEFLDLKPQVETSLHHRRVPRPLTQGIEFRNVSFRYPGEDSWVLQGVNLHLRPGEKLALVGTNGAGKTTLIKLLTRLYDPTEGTILLDGVDLRDYDLEDVRACIGVIFQDFVHYQATARENIGFGQIDALGNEPRIVAASERGGADEVIASLPQHYDTMLGHWFSEGHELSGGQWQKIALSRAFMRDSEILVLDEPTASLDAEREYEIFQRFRELTDGKTAILISHRFSTVRMADCIAVLKHGQVVELGSHRELLALGGDYARLFTLQAEGYR
ncbi:MAG: ABC transporter ATP-binding protein [Chloroflexaceae bacterium]|nr:ABC transporter ATP-binding protein [Chloroflexaceae bacterium]